MKREKLFRNLVGLLLFVLLIAGLSASLAETKTETESAIFKYESGTITEIDTISETLIIPASLDGNKISSVADRAVIGRSDVQDKVKTLVIEEGIRSIGASFFGMINLKEVYLPNSLRKIDIGAFENCPSLTEIHLPDGLQLSQIGSRAFYGIGAETLVLKNGTDLMPVSMASYREEGDSKTASRLVFSCCKDGFIYLVQEDNSAVIIDYYKRDYSDSMVIPETLNGHPVREIGRMAFTSKPITSLVLPEGLEKIGEKAFYECKSLYQVSLPSTLREIGDQAFSGVAAEKIELPEGVQSVSPDWYSGADKTDATGKWTYQLLDDGTAMLVDYEYTPKMVFPAEVDGIPVTEINKARYSSGSREKKEKVTTIVVPEGVKILGIEAFSSMYSLKKVTLPASMTHIRKSAFHGCIKLQAIAIPVGLTAIEEKVFASCRSLKSAVIPEGVRIIENCAFELCNSLKTLKLPSTLEEIHSRAFYQNYALASVMLPDSLRVIGDHAFSGCPVSQWTIPAGVQSVGQEALSAGGCGNFAKKVTILGANTVLGDSVMGTDSSGEQYYRVPPLTSDNKTLTVVCLPGSTADRWFRFGVKKTYLKWGPECIRTAPVQKVLEAGLYSPQDPVYELTIPEGVEEIADEAFKGLSLYKVSLPSTLKTIGKEAFADCFGLTEIELPDSVVEMGDGCFRGCKSLKTISIPEGVRKIPDHAFEGCESLASLTLPEGIEEIGTGAFLQDSSTVKKLYSVFYGKTTASSLKTLKLPASLKTIGENAFACCDALTTVTFAKNAQVMEIAKDAFVMCVQLKEIKLPDSVEHVGAYAFANCLNMKKVDLGKGVTSVGDNAFMSCYSMVSLKAPDTLQEIGSDLLDDCSLKLVVTCPGNSAMDVYIRRYYSRLKVKNK